MTGQLFTVAVPVYVVELETVVVCGLFVPITDEPLDHEYEVGVRVVLPPNLVLSLVVLKVTVVETDVVVYKTVFVDVAEK